MFVLLDLSAAFNTTDGHIPLKRLEHLIGIKEMTLNWLKSYLSVHFHFVRVNFGCSVPQGLMLGPILFNLNVHPLGNITWKQPITFFDVMRFIYQQTQMTTFS